MTSRNLRVLEDLKKSLVGEEQAPAETRYSYQEFIIDGCKVSTMSDIVPRTDIDDSPEAITTKSVIRMFETSIEHSTRRYAPTLRELYEEQKNNSEKFEATLLFRIVKDCEEKSFRTQPGSVDRELLLIDTMNKLNNAYGA